METDPGMWLSMLAPRIPLLVVWVVAAVIAGVRWNRHPVSSALTVSAACIGILTSVAGAGVTVMMVRDRGSPSASVVRNNFISTGISLMGAVAFSLLVAAVFTDRGTKRETYPSS